ncbi:MAG: hypothetical protein A2Z51_12505 [Deltaproteobacteria bacterium RBG_19FT_COMBO_52_11]|nr:MAG: hypothetical protein A2Z51_12505 [Deltaproteobacteria bacterium RBG_19FT_COMBO_52_11]
MISHRPPHLYPLPPQAERGEGEADCFCRSNGSRLSEIIIICIMGKEEKIGISLSPKKSLTIF